MYRFVASCARMLSYRLGKYSEYFDSKNDLPISNNCSNDLPRLLINSVEKSGTHLAAKLVESIGFIGISVHLQEGLYQLQNGKGNLSGWSELAGCKSYCNPQVLQQSTTRTLARILQGQYVQGHLSYNSVLKKYLRSKKFKLIMMIRDPRDVVLSWLTHQSSRPDLAPSFSCFYYYNSFSSMSEKISAAIKGLPQSNIGRNSYVPSILEIFDTKIDWLAVEDVCAIKYEEIVGSRGGGCDKLQMNCLMRLCAYLGVSFHESELVSMARNIYGGSLTFNKGKVGSWRDVFTSEHRDLFKQVTGDLLIRTGYEVDDNW